MIITLSAVENSKRQSGQEISRRQVTSNRSNGKPRFTCKTEFHFYSKISRKRVK